MDGIQSIKYPARLHYEKQNQKLHLTVEEDFPKLQFDRSQFKALPLLGDEVGIFEFSNGARFETRDIEKFELLRVELKENVLYERILKNNTLILSLLGLTVTVLLLNYFVIIPKSSSILASMVPNKVLQVISDQTKKTFSLLDLGNDAELSDEEFTRTKKIFNHMHDLFPNENLHFKIIRSDGFGKNAFALPDGSIYITDKFLRALPNDDHIIAVLLHEIGHVRLRHGTRQVISAAGVGLVVTALFGTETNLTHVPATLMIYSYSRSFETEADSFAAENLRRMKLQPRLLGEALKLIEHTDDEAVKIPAFLSTHPLTEERMQNLDKP